MRRVINVGILGAGRIAVMMAQTVRRMMKAGMGDVELYCVASRDTLRAMEFAKNNGVTHAYGSYEEMLQDPNLDLVYVATPHSHHSECVKMCIEHGKHVLCEKAFTVNADQAEEVFQLAREKGVLVTEAIWTRYQPMRQTIHEAVWSGEIGTPRALTANLFYQITDKERLVKKELAGGALLDVGIYPLNFAEMVFGRADGCAAHATFLDSGVDETDSITLTWRDGKLANLSAGLSAVSDRDGIIYGSKGFIKVTNINNPQKLAVYDLNYRKVREAACPPQLTGYEYEVAEAADAIRGGKTECASMPHEETVHMMKLMDSIRAQIGLRYPDLE